MNQHYLFVWVKQSFPKALSDFFAYCKYLFSKISVFVCVKQHLVVADIAQKTEVPQDIFRGKDDNVSFSIIDRNNSEGLLLAASLHVVQRGSGNTEPGSSNYTVRAIVWAWVEGEISMTSVSGTKKRKRKTREICTHKRILGEFKEQRERWEEFLASFISILLLEGKNIKSSLGSQKCLPTHLPDFSLSSELILLFFIALTNFKFYCKVVSMSWLL